MREGKDTKLDRQEFMRQLEQLLLFVPIQEKEEALQYYNDYFEDAGPENEQEVIASLGSPEKIAENIKRDINQSYYGAEPDKVEAGKEIAEYHPMPEIVEVPYVPENNVKKKWPTWLIVVILICAFPFLGSLLGTVVGTLGLWFLLWVAFLLGSGAVGVGCTIGGICAIVMGCKFWVESTGIGMLFVGGGMIVLSFGVLGILIEYLLIKKWTPAIIKGIKKIFHKIKNLGKERM